VSARFLALGDSYTIGEGVEPSERWPVQLVRELRSGGTAIDDPAIVATTGWTTDELLDAIDGANLEGPFAIVTLLIGVNDQYRVRGSTRYHRGLAPLFDRALKFADGVAQRVIVLSIPDWGVTPFAAGDFRTPDEISSEIDQFNDVNESGARQIGARYVDVTDISRLARTDRSLLTSDGLHPSGRMYALWVKELLPVARALLTG
jgi:lysophospholipase L1-like esterase